MSETASIMIELTVEVVSAYVSNNRVEAAALPALLASVHSALNAAAVGRTEATATELSPAVSIKKSVTPDAIICLEDGKSFKSLKRHLRTKYNLTPEEYRAKWGLPASYPMVAPNYAAARSNLAKQMGLGQQRPKTEAPAAKTVASAPKAKGRPRKAA